MFVKVKLRNLKLYDVFLFEEEYYRILAFSKKKYYKTVLAQNGDFKRKWFDLDTEVYIYD
jgi:hypothetical protein